MGLFDIPLPQDKNHLLRVKATLMQQPQIPLAARIRPRTLPEFYGQKHLLGEGRILSECARRKILHSMILWGPPGTGKTTLARLLAQCVDAEMLELSAVSSGVKDIRSVVEYAQTRARKGDRTVLFVDEVHRFSKSQQDAFLPHIEQGLFTFIGATTENPSFELNGALLSRARVHVLKPLTEEDLLEILDNSLNKGFETTLEFPLTLRKQLVSAVMGDARKLLNSVETLVELAEDGMITEANIKEILSTSVPLFDKNGEHFYDIISALHKSIRGSHPDAALYWFCRMLVGGVDPLYIARRLIRVASEDIGNADPRALELTLNAWNVQERLGSPEGELALAQAVIYLACAAKSNAVYTAFAAAKQEASRSVRADVPIHLRNAPTKLMKELGYAKAYRYAHDEPNAYAAGETYLPEGIHAGYYHPTDRGLEKQIKEKLNLLKSLDRQPQTVS